MCAKIIRSLVCLFFFAPGAFATGPGERRSCAAHLATHRSGDAQFDINESDAVRLKIGDWRAFEAGGTRWMAAHQTRDGRTLVASIDAHEELHVYDVDQNLEIATGAPLADDGIVHTRGEWADQPDGTPVVVLGGQTGLLHWYGIEPDSFRDYQATDLASPVLPLAISDDQDGPHALVLVGDRLYRIRVMPGAPAMRTYADLQTVSRVLKAAHFKSSRGPRLIAAITRDEVEVFAATGGPSLYAAPLTNGERATATWFEDWNGDAVLVVIDANHVQLHFPLNHRQRAGKVAELAGQAAGRVHALSTPAGSAFILAPGSEGVEIFRYDQGELRPWSHLPTAVARHQKGIFRAPNGRVYIVWTEEESGRAPQMHISKLAREMAAPVDSLPLRPLERVHHVQALIVNPRRHLLFVKTNQRLLVRTVEPELK